MTDQLVQVRAGGLVSSTAPTFEDAVSSHWSVSFQANPAQAHDFVVFHSPTEVSVVEVKSTADALIRGQMAVFIAAAPGPLPVGTVAELRGDKEIVARVRTVLTSAAFEGGSNEARTRQLVSRKIHHVWELKDGWGGPGSLAPSYEARALYMSVIQVLPPRFLAAAQPTPTTDGGLHMEWTRSQYDFSAEITSDGQLILNAYAPNERDDYEKVIDRPTADDLADFICRGA